jgi:O-antigen ligase/tetratricopeptide (TPR) repeat protein
MQYTKYLRWALLFGLSLVFFIPFLIADGGVLPNMFFPFITGKNFAFRILVELLLGIYLILALREPKYRPRASWLLWAAGAFVVWLGLTTATSLDPVKSFWSNFERMEGYVTILHLFVYFVIAGAVVTAEKWWDRFFNVSVSSSVIMACYALLQVMGVLAISTQSGARADTTFGNAIYLAVFMLFNFFITLYLLVRASHKERPVAWLQSVYGLALVLQFAALFFTQTRGSILGLLGGLLVAGVYIAVRAQAPEWRTLRRMTWYGLGVLAIVVIGFFALRNTAVVQSSQTLSRLASLSLTDRTTQARVQIWTMAYQGFEERPVLGWGAENFSFVFNKYYEASMYNQEQWFDRAHNQFLDWLIAGGLPAFALYLALFVLAAWLVVTSRVLSVPEQAVFLGLLAAYAFNNLIVFGDLISSVYFFTILAFVHGFSQRELPGFMALSKPLSDRGVMMAAPIVGVVVLLGVWMLNAPGIARARNIIAAVTTQVPIADGKGGIAAGPKNPKQNIEEFTVAFSGPWPGTPLGRQEVVEQLLQFANASARSAAIDPAVKKDIFALAESSGLALLAERPNDARLELFMASLYETFGQYPQAEQYITQALEHSPKKQQLMFQLGVIRLNAGDTAGAIAMLKQAFDSEPAYEDARILYASGLFYANNKAVADALLVEGFGTVLVDDPRLLQVYTNTKQFDRLIGIWQARVDAQPNNAETRFGLATAYFAAGDTQNTILTLEKAAGLDIRLAPQIQSLIQQIKNGTLKPGQ